jgi:DNA-binding transcriptional MerR regulator
MNLMKVNEAARELGVSEAWLRRAEGRGRIPMARRDINGWRVYSEEDIAALRAVLVPTLPAAPP